MENRLAVADTGVPAPVEVGHLEGDIAVGPPPANIKTAEEAADLAEWASAEGFRRMDAVRLPMNSGRINRDLGQYATGK